MSTKEKIDRFENEHGRLNKKMIEHILILVNNAKDESKISSTYAAMLKDELINRKPRE